MAAGLSDYRDETEAFSTKIGLSIGAAMGFSSLLDELPSFARIKKDRQPFRTIEVLWRLRDAIKSSRI